MFKVDYRYAIQVGAFRNPVPRVYFDKFQNVKVYLGYDNIYRYTLGEYPEEQVAQNDLKEVRKVIGDAFVCNVDSYVVQQKIRNDVQGDKISDDELLLIRLKNLEIQEKAKRNRPQPQKTRRYLEKPRDTEMAVRRSAYTVVLMSVNQVLDMSKFNGIREMDVYEVEDGATVIVPDATIEGKMRRMPCSVRVIWVSGKHMLPIPANTAMSGEGLLKTVPPGMYTV
ncbi:SPOR domain-containing protein [Odoribacter sp. OF09-27XD]|nr:SPOR domain-containing protein [Odoribacter sp. OF09-27XD]RHV97517.1 SPOR domain-containing protein [Odoribacter sp. OF09-27XD]